jgi:SH3-like domain-containing protein
MAARGGGCTRRIVAVCAVVAVLAGGAATAADRERPVPRFASLKSDEVNLRSGPGERYPIEWVLKRKDMPVEILREFSNWLRVRDWQGTEGWIHERMVSGKREVIVAGTIRALRRQPDPDAVLVARAEPGVVARLLECQGAWCRIESGDIGGWLRRNDVWGVYPDEAVP